MWNPEEWLIHCHLLKMSCLIFCDGGNPFWLCQLSIVHGIEQGKWSFHLWNILNKFCVFTNSNLDNFISHLTETIKIYRPKRPTKWKCVSKPMKNFFSINQFVQYFPQWKNSIVQKPEFIGKNYKSFKIDHSDRKLV